MNATLRLPPRVAWLPASWKRRAFWRTVGRFVLWGPPVGALPYLWLVFSLPVAYAIGALPAFGAGLLYASWLHGIDGPTPGWRWRATFGALSGVAVTAFTAWITVVVMARADWTAVWVVGLHGVPAATVLALAARRGRSGAAGAEGPSIDTWGPTAARPAGSGVSSQAV